MTLNKKIGFLLDSGFPPNFISSLNESKINVLYEKVSKGEQSEAVQTTQQSGFVTTITQGTKANLSIPSDATISTTPDKGIKIQSTKAPVGTGETSEGEMTEKFESKAQQGLFWAKCNKCKDDDCKWCKMAKEFSKSTSKKQYKTMPKKKETKEQVDYLDAVKSAMVGGMKKNLNSSLINPKLKTESNISNEFKNIIEKNLKPTMNKRDLIRLIEASMSDTETDKGTETEEKKKTETGNPFKRPKTKDDPEAKRMKKESFTQQDFMKQVKNSGLI